MVGEVAARMAAWRGEARPTVGPPRTPSPGAGPVYDVLPKDGAAVLVGIGDYLWLPENFAPLVRPAAAGSDGACTSPGILERLLTPSVETLASLDRELSEALAQRPRDACLHEAAAALIGAFQMREVPSAFADERPGLNRMAAHLALARASRGGSAPGPEGRVADLMLRAIAWRHDGFRELLPELAERATGPERTWLRALLLYSVQDWRVLPDPASATLAEQIAYVMAVGNTRDASQVNEALDLVARSPRADWTRLAFQRVRERRDLRPIRRARPATGAGGAGRGLPPLHGAGPGQRPHPGAQRGDRDPAAGAGLAAVGRLRGAAQPPRAGRPAA